MKIKTYSTLLAASIILALPGCVLPGDDFDSSSGGDTRPNNGGLPSATNGSGGDDNGDETGDDEPPPPPPPPPASLSEQICERYDECNLLGAGYSVAECTEDMESCVDDRYNDAGAQDWWNEAEACLSKQDCQNLGNCVSDLGTCSLFGCHNACVYCNEGIVCDDEWYNDGVCDCECSNWVDPDCP